MAAGIVAEDLKMLSQVARLRRPHAMIGPDRMRQHQHQGARVTFEAIENLGFPIIEQRHLGFASFSVVRARLSLFLRLCEPPPKFLGRTQIAFC